MRSSVSSIVPRRNSAASEMRREPKLRASAAGDYPFDRRNDGTYEYVSQDPVVDPVARKSDYQAEVIEGHASMCPAKRP